MIAKEVKPLTERLESIAKGEGTREAQRRGEDSRDDFIRNYMPDFPRDIVRQLLPATEDKQALAKAAKSIDTAFKEFVQLHARRGLIRFVNLGGDNGVPMGTTTHQLPIDFNKVSPTEAIAAGMVKREQSGYRAGGR
jgi:hypothetical protein